MHTIEELEYIRRGIWQRGTLDQQELVYFGRSLHELFLSVGLNSIYGIPNSYYAYELSKCKKVRVYTGTRGLFDLITVSEYSNSLIFTNTSYPDPYTRHIPIQGLVDKLQALSKEEDTWEYYQPCHYSDKTVEHCGLGIGPALGCTHLTTNQTHG